MSNVTNSIAYGSGNFVIDKIKVDLNNPVFIDLLLRFPQIKTLASFEDQFNFGWINSKTKGKLTTWLANLRIRITCKGVYENRNGQQYVRMNSIKVIPKVTQIKIKRDDPVSDRTLNEAINSFMNQNVDLFIPEVETSIRISMSE